MWAPRCLVGIALVLTAALSACSPGDPEVADRGPSFRSPETTAPSPTPTERRGPPPRLRLTEVASGLEDPIAMVDAGEGLFLVAEQVGTIRRLEGRRLLRHPMLDIADRITHGGERGLLGLALHPEWARNGRFFVNYTDTRGDTVVSEFNRKGLETSERVLLRIEQPFANHNGGHLAFGPDGYLYIATGDGGSGGDPLENGQSTDTLLGKILRIDVDGRRPYAIPPDNPFAQGGGRPEIWAYGLRNPWRFSFDRATRDLWVGDVGQTDWEEIDRLGPRQAGANLGWNTLEGTHCYDPPDGCRSEGTVPPVAEYSHNHGCSVTGGYVYRGRSLPQLSGTYLFADYCSGTVWALDAGFPKNHKVVAEASFSVSSFAEDAQGEVYVLDHSGGRVLRIRTTS